jgi:putative transport protein
MLNGFRDILVRHPEIEFFLVLRLGYLLGKLSLGSVRLRAVTGPQFFRGLESDGLQHAALAAVVAMNGVTRAVGNVLLAIRGTVIVALIA